MTELECSRCGAVFPQSFLGWQCPCGGLLDLRFQPLLETEKLGRFTGSIWRYRQALPLSLGAVPQSLGEGLTPLTDSDLFDFPVLLKADCLLPSGSFKDRGASMLVSKVKELGIRRVVEDSSGNAGASIAAYCARAGIECDIYVPLATAPVKCRQIEHYGARLHRRGHTREETALAARQAARKAYYASHAYNPFFFHGVKTLAFEICEQLDWNFPERVFAPLGNGTLVLGLFLGFTELRKLGIINGLPEIFAVQAEVCNPLVQAFRGNQNFPQPGKYGRSKAEGISVARPVRGSQVLQAVRRSHGHIMDVSEQEIEQWWKKAALHGFFIEPSSAVALAGVNRYFAEQGKSEGRTVAVLTGHGLKAV